MRLLLCFLLLTLGPLARGAGLSVTPGGGGASLVLVSNIAIQISPHSITPQQERWSFNLLAGTNLNFMAIGDSTGLDVFSQMLERIYTYVGSNGFAPHPFTQHGYGAATNTSSTDSTNWPGTYWNIHTNAVSGPGGIATTNYSSANSGAEYVDKFRFRGEFRPDGGQLILFLKTNGGSWNISNTYSLSNTYGAWITNYTVPLGWWNARLQYSNGGICRVFGHIDAWNSLGRGMTAMPIAQAGGRIGLLTNMDQTVLGKILSNMNPTVLFGEWQDSSNEMVDALPKLSTLFSNWIPKTDIVLIGTHPVDPTAAGVTEQELKNQDSVQREYARAHGWAYYQMRDLPHFDNQTNMTNFYLPLGGAGGDGVHAPVAAKQAKASLVVQLSSMLNNIGLVDGLVNGGLPEGARIPALGRGSNVWTGAASWGSYVSVNGNLGTYGSGANLDIDDVGSPGTASRWHISAFQDKLRFLYGAANDAYWHSGHDTDNYRYFAPMSGVSTVARLGTQTFPWNESHAYGRYSHSNGNTAVYIVSQMTNGDCWSGMISNKYQVGAMTNNVMFWKILWP